MRDSIPVRIRRAREDDAANIERLVGSLSRDSIVMRFLGGVSRDTAVRELVREVGAEGGDIAFVAEDAAGEIVGEAYAAVLSPGDAEAAFVVRDCDQHRGVGTALLAAIVAALRVRGITTLHADTSPANAAMLALLHEGDLPMQIRRLDGSVHVTLRLGDTRVPAAGAPER